MLRACFLPAAITEFPEDAIPLSLSSDPAAPTLIPLLAWRWGDQLPAGLNAQLLRLTFWRQGRERLVAAESIASTLREAGIDSVFLKGTALIARYYPDPGVRAVGDVDFQVPHDKIREAAAAMIHAGWRSEEDLSASEIETQKLAKHAWQFYKPTDSPDALESDSMCDLHWHPVVRCYSPRVAELFLEGAETVETFAGPLRIPCAADLLFHVLVHGLQWSWTSPIRWIPDAWFVMRSGAVDWERLRALATLSDSTYRVHRALEYLKLRLDAPVPQEILDSLAPAARWEAREQKILETPAPLSLLNAALWHVYNFKRLRRADPVWKASNVVSGFLSYLKIFFRAPRTRDIAPSVRRRLQAHQGSGGHP